MQKFKLVLAIIFAEIILVFAIIANDMFFKCEIFDVIFSNNTTRELLLSSLVIAGPFTSLISAIPFHGTLTTTVAVISFAMAAVVVWRVVLWLQNDPELKPINKWLVFTWFAIGFVNVFLIIGYSI